MSYPVGRVYSYFCFTSIVARVFGLDDGAEGSSVTALPRGTKGLASLSTVISRFI